MSEERRDGSGAPALLRELLAEGGIAVRTEVAGPAGRPSSWLVTVIQPDGDLLVMLSPELVANTAAWDRHCRAVATRLDPLRELQGNLGRFFAFAGVAITAAWELHSSSSYAGLQLHHWVEAALFTLLLALHRRLGGLLFHLVGQRLIRRVLR